MIRTLLVATLLSANVAIAADPVLPWEGAVVPLIKDGVAIYDQALNVLLAMHIAGCVKLDITPINYTWTATNKEGCKK